MTSFSIRKFNVVGHQSRMALLAVERKISSVKGSLLQNSVHAFWWNNVRNFGDFITPLLLKHYGMTPIHSPIEQSKIVSTGSLLQCCPKNYSGYVLGTGLIYKRKINFKNAIVLALRGELTKECAGVSKDITLGDPGLLALKLLDGSRKQKKFLLGIVPHYDDKKDDRIIRFISKYPKDILLIDVQRNPIYVFKKIDSCENILSSSLHGIVVADSLRIPNKWMVLSNKVIGAGFKFNDYFSALKEYDTVPEIIRGDEKLSFFIERMRKTPSIVSECIDKIEGAFQHFIKEIKETR